jgi:hypothetical protein
MSYVGKFFRTAMNTSTQTILQHPAEGSREAVRWLTSLVGSDLPDGTQIVRIVTAIYVSDTVIAVVDTKPSEEQRQFSTYKDLRIGKQRDII